MSMADEPTNPSSDGDDHEDLDDRIGDGQQHDIVVPDTAEALREIWSQPPDETLGKMIALVTGLMLNEQRAVAAIVDEIMEDPEDFTAHEMAVRFALVTAAICSDQGVSPEHYARVPVLSAMRLLVLLVVH